MENSYNAAKSILLASGSEIRKTLLSNAGILCTVQKVFVDELRIRQQDSAQGLTSAEIASHLSAEKAAAVSRKFPESIVLGCDQTLEFEGQTLGKAENLSELRAQLCAFRGKRHALHSGAALYRGGKPLWQGCDTAWLQMRAFSDTFLEQYIAAEGDIVLSCVGGYRLEGMGIQLFESFKGEYFTILGLPLLPMLSALQELGVLQK